jgi:hypothetical protein
MSMGDEYIGAQLWRGDEDETDSEEVAVLVERTDRDEVAVRVAFGNGPRPSIYVTADGADRLAWMLLKAATAAR